MTDAFVTPYEQHAYRGYSGDGHRIMAGPTYQLQRLIACVFYGPGQYGIQRGIAGNRACFLHRCPLKGNITAATYSRGRSLQ